MGKPDAAVNILTISSAPWPLFNRDNLEATAEFLGYENYHSPSIFHSIQIDPTLHTQFCENDIDEFDESQLLDQCTQIVLELQPDKRDQLQENNEALSTEYVNEKADDFISIACFMPQDIFKDFVRGFNRSQARKVDFGEVTDDMDVKVVLSAFEMNRQKKDVFLRIDPAITLLPPMRNLAASLILRRRTHHIFDPESSHMVRTLTLMSQFELQQAKQMCSIRGSIGDETVLAPSYLLCPEWAAHFKETPKPNAFNRDIMSFLFRLVATFPKRCLQDMPVLLPHDWRMVNEYLRRLIAMGCIHQPMSGREELKINKGRGYNMRKLMHIENDFHSLFLLGGIETDMPSALKRVFIRLSVIVSGDNYKFKYMNEAPETDPVTKRGLKLECSIGIGKEFCTNGGIWLALGLWESHMERYKVVSSPERQKVFFGDRIILYHEEAKRIQERVNELEQLLELDPLTEADEEALSKDDILIIEIELVKSRIHNLVYFRKPANEDDDVKGLDCTSGKWLETNYDDIVDWTSYFRPEYDGFFAIYLWLEQPVPGQYVACGLTAVSTEAAMHVLKDVATVPDATGQPTLQLSLLLSTYPDMK
ncbi:hypothetical protein UCRPA7_1396 [Phaeoacremonium minimum UCRPA7]|uniref:Uncharacterized protein n=1 Tax=Phaeoacremonium minimum (strain UCR-PA7) TaxID=1286976 RepID=R8BUX0_PHAM7|nr:hypothetical protein UCRPA7_1396 [Phaeoacremonium minimum UCRPA7]EOO03089.1 hypothetical protein UCRPA7_1396 [Phaeoacremonium minimum UCRPA7]